MFLMVVLPTEKRFNSVDFFSKVMVIPNLNFGGGGLLLWMKNRNPRLQASGYTIDGHGKMMAF